MNIQAITAIAADKDLQIGTVSQRELRPDDVQVDILYCGVCHSDLHMARNEWGMSLYPMVPGHEIVGRVAAVGNEVTRFQPGQLVGVGVMVDSCGQCSHCQQQEEQYCDQGFVATYNGTDRHSGATTFGGYAQSIVTKQEFVLSVPESLPTHAVAPLLCAGVTVWSPLKYWGVKAGDHIGVIGLGGLGHMAVKLATALGAKVTLFTTSPDKAADGIALGAETIVLSKDPAQMESAAQSLDMILDCVAAPHDLDPYLATLKTNGRLVLVGIPDAPHKAPNVTPMVFRRLSVSGTSIGSIKETQEMLDFCGEHNITADVEMIQGDQIEQAFERMANGQVKYRFVIDIKATQWD